MALALFASLSTLVGTSVAQAQSWQSCAQEQGTCVVPGTARVRLGSGNLYAYAVARERIACQSSAFGGDPAPGVPKKCEWLSQPVSAAPAGAAISGTGEVLPRPGAAWSLCGLEGARCNLTGPMLVRFGNDDNGWTNRSFAQGGPVLCTPSTFGLPDAASGSPRRCDTMPGEAPAASSQASARPSASSATPASAGELRDASGIWDACAGEGGTCFFQGGPVQLRYGARDKWHVTTAKGTFRCSIDTFRIDPIKGVRKACFVKR